MNLKSRWELTPNIPVFDRFLCWTTSWKYHYGGLTYQWNKARFLWSSWLQSHFDCSLSFLSISRINVGEISLTTPSFRSWFRNFIDRWVKIGNLAVESWRSNHTVESCRRITSNKTRVYTQHWNHLWVIKKRQESQDIRAWSQVYHCSHNTWPINFYRNIFILSARLGCFQL